MPDILIIFKFSAMNRRDTLKTLMLASGSLIALPSWAKDWQVSDLASHHSSFSFQEQNMLASVADTIIPPGNSIGALSVGVDKFLQKLLTNCYEKDVQDNVAKQLVALDGKAKSTYGNSFITCDQIQRQTLLTNLSISADKNEKD